MNTNKNKNSIFGDFLLHLHPKSVNEQTIKYTRTFGLGGINALLFVIMAFTGLLLRFSYIPTQENAYNSITNLQENSLFGYTLRNIHHWSAMLMIFTAFLHLLRVFYSQSVFYKRQKNWFYGLVLFTIVLSFNFTGYLLQWDQLSYWAVSIMTNIIEYIPFVGDGFANIIRGGDVVNENTLLNFYNFHTALLPLFFLIFMSLHFWLIRKAGGVTFTEKEKMNLVNVNPNLIYKEIVVALIVTFAIILFSLFINAPLLEKANPLISPNPSKAPWYFMGIQELLINLHPLLVSLFIPFAIILFFIIVAKQKIDKEKIGVWFYSDKGKKLVFLSIIFAFILSFLLIIILDYTSHFNNLELPLFIKTGIIPLLMYFIPTTAFIFLIKNIYKADKTELLISIMTLILSSYILMSIVGVFLRGESMHLIF